MNRPYNHNFQSFNICHNDFGFYRVLRRKETKLVKQKGGYRNYIRKTEGNVVYIFEGKTETQSRRTNSSGIVHMARVGTKKGSSKFQTNIKG